MKTFFKIVALQLLVILALACNACSSTPHNICKKAERISGEIMYIYPSRTYDCRTIVLKDKGKCVVIYNVPFDQPLTNIPVCKKGSKYYWVMP